VLAAGVVALLAPNMRQMAHAKPGVEAIPLRKVG
jgi:hypothetical protein